nr:uncharacterized protein LOC129131569 [Agelaius phoeniceus]
MGERCPGTPRTARRGHGAPGTAGAPGRGPQGSGGAGRGRGALRVAALSLALLFLRAEAEGFALCHAPALQTKVFQYRLWDVNQRSLYLRDDQLVAGHLQGANAALEEKVFWVPNRALEPARLPVILSVRHGSRCLRTERGPAGEPRLRLQDVDIRELPRAGDSAAAFTFFRSYRDGLWRFESAAHPGWFLCTSPRGHQPLALCRHCDVTSHLLDFYFQLCPAMSRASRAALRRTPQGHRLGVMAGSWDTVEGVIDPDMVALFDDFLGTGECRCPRVPVPPQPQPYHYVLRDTEQQGLCLRDGRLVATSLQVANAAQEEPISVVPNRHLERRRCPLIVGIRGGTRALSCGTGPEPRLSLEDVGLLELFSGDKDRATPFTFYKTFGGSTHTFEAAAFPGLFLSTATGPDEPLGLAPPPSATAFYLRRK